MTQIALGKSEEAEYKDGIHKVSEQLIGEVSNKSISKFIVFSISETYFQVGLLFTNRDSKEVEDYFNSYNRAAFARSNGEYFFYENGSFK